MPKLALLLASCILLSSAALSDGFDSGDARSMSMGGTGTASADPYIAQIFNPALLADTSNNYNFSLLLPAGSAYVDDQKGLFSYIEEFAESDLQAIQDLENFQLQVLLTALNGADPSDPLASEQDKLSFSANLTALLGGTANVLGEVSGLLSAITAANGSDSADPAVAEAAARVYGANNNLRGHNAAFDSKLVTLQEESVRIQNALVSTRRGIIGLNDRSLSLGGQVGAGANLGFDTFNAGFSYHTKTSMNVQALVESSDLDPLELATREIDNVAQAASGASSAVTEWTLSIDELTAALEQFNQARTNYSLCNTFSTCASALTEMRNQANAISTLAQQISDDSVEVNQKIQGVTGYTTPGCEDGAPDPKPSSECPVKNGMFNFAWFSEQLTNSQNAQTVLRVSGVVLTEASIAYATEVDLFGGFAIGIAPKLQHFGVVATDIRPQDAALITNNPLDLIQDQRSYFGMNADIGAAKTWQIGQESRVTTGLMLADIFPKKILLIEGSGERPDAYLRLKPQLRVGAAYDWANFAMVSADLDITANTPVGIGTPTRYIGLGAELDLFNAAALRVGYRNNLKDDLPGSVSAGVGITPFGIGVSIGGYIIPSSELTEAIATFGFSGQLSLKF